MAYRPRLIIPFALIAAATVGAKSPRERAPSASAAGGSASAESAAASAASSAGEREGPDEPLRVNVETIVELIREQNPRLMVERAGVRRALERSYQRRAELLPQLSITGEQTRQRISQGFTGRDVDAIHSNSFDAMVSGSQTLFDAEKYADYKLAQLEKRIEELDYETALQDILEQALTLHFTQLRDLRAIELSRATIQRNRELLRITESRFEAGSATRIDVTRSEVELARAKRELLQNKTEATDSELQLKALLDVDLDRELVFDKSIVQRIEDAPDMDRYRAMKEKAYLRPELKQREEELEQAKLSRKAAVWQRFPTVEMFGEWGYTSDVVLDGEESRSWIAGIRVDIPIFEGGSIGAERREARAAVRESEQRLREVKNRVERAYRFALQDVKSRYQQILIAREEEQLAKAELKLARDRYQEGIAGNTELIDAQQRLDEAEDNYSEAIFRYGLSRIALARSLGQVQDVLE